MRRILFFFLSVCLFFIISGLTADQIIVWDDEGVSVRNGMKLSWEGNGAYTHSPDGTVFKTWVKCNSGYNTVYLQGINEQGAIWAEPVEVASSDETKEYPSVIITTEGNLVVVWKAASVKAQKLDVLGNLLWDNELELFSNPAKFNSFKIAAAEDDGFYFAVKSHLIGDFYLKHILSDGTFHSEWPQGGVEINSGYYVDDRNTLMTAEDGGVVLLYVSSLNVMFVKYNPDSSIAWETTLSENSFSHTLSLARLNDGTYGVSYFHYPGGYYLASIDLQGNIVWDTNIYSDFGVACNPVIVPSEGNNLFLVTQERYSLENTIYIYYISGDGTQIWDEPIIPYSSDLELAPTYLTADYVPGQGVVLTWEENHCGYHSEISLSAQLVGYNGDLLWSEDGINISLNRPYGSRVSTHDDSIYILWKDLDNGFTRLITQKFDFFGNELFTEEQSVVSSVYGGYVYGKMTVNSAGNTYIIWEDIKWNQYVNLKIQKLNEDGSFAFGEHGITIAQKGYYRLSDAIGDENGGVVVAWRDDTRQYIPGGTADVYVQKIDQNGNLFWGDDGILMSDSEEHCDGNPKLFADGTGEYYVAWERLDPSISWNRSIYGQRLINGLKQWDETGKNLTPSYLHADLELEDLKGKVIAFRANWHTLKTLKFDSEGNVSVGWPVGGIEIDLISALNPRLIGIFEKNGCYYIFSKQSNHLTLHKILTTGEMISPVEGILLFSDINGFIKKYDVLMDNDIFYVSYLHNDYNNLGGSVISLLKFDMEGNNLWEQPLQIIENDSIIFQYDYKKVLYDQELLFLITDLYNLKAQLVDVNTGFHFGIEGGEDVYSTTNQLSYMQVVNSPDQTAIVNLVESFSQVNNLIAQKINMDRSVWTLSTKDEILTPQVFELHQNYPNPFNPDTMISFTLGEPSKVSLSIYNIKGQLVTNLISSEYKQAGNYQLNWQGLDMFGNLVGSGVYLYQLKINSNKQQTNKMIMLK